MRLAEENPRIEVIELMNEYAVLYVPEDAMEQVAMAPEVEYVEKPKRMYFAVQEGKQASCITPVQSARYNLTGKGVIVAVLDSGEPVTVLPRHCCFSFFSGVGTADILSACETAG